MRVVGSTYSPLPPPLPFPRHRGNRLRGDFLRRGRSASRAMHPAQWGDLFGVPCTRPQLARAACRTVPRASRTSHPTPLRLFKGGDAKTLPPWRLATHSLRQWATTSTLAGLAPPSLPSLASSRRALPSLSQDAPPAPFLRSQRALHDPDDLNDLDERPGRPRRPRRAETALDSRAGNLDACALLSTRGRAGNLEAWASRREGVGGSRRPRLRRPQRPRRPRRLRQPQLGRAGVRRPR